MSKNFNQHGKMCTDEKCMFTSWKSHTHRNHRSNENKVHPNILHTIGCTPMVKLNKIPQLAGLKCDVYAKVEFFNPGGSTKDRISFRMVEDAEEKGLLKPGCTIIEPTSGNTGIGVAMACAVKGYKCVIVMPEKMSDEKVSTMHILGAKVVRTPNEIDHDHPDGLFGVANRLNREIADSVIFGQFTNISNPLVHYDTTAEEIVEQCDGKVDMLVLGAGTGGSMTGISYKLKEHCPDCEIVGVDPIGSNLALPATMNKTDVTFFEIEGIGYKFICEILDRQFVSRWYKTDDKLSLQMVRRLIREEGILAGGSSGAILAGALIAAKDLKEGQTCVVILPDGIRNYMTKFVTDNWMEARGFQEIVNEHNHWWWNHKVAELAVPLPKTIKSSATCKEALKFLESSGLDRVPVESADGTLEGFLNLKHLTKKVVSQNYQLGDSIQKAVFKQFQRVTKDTVLGLVSRILETDEFVAIVDESNCPIGVITHLQLLNFIAKNSELNGLKIANGNTNGQTNGH